MKKRNIIFIVIIVVIILGYYNYTREKEIDEKCNVHDVHMKRGMVPILYGLITGTLLSYAKEEFFPNANTSTMGGCIVGFRHRERVIFCDKCRENEKEAKVDLPVLEEAVPEIRNAIDIDDVKTILTDYRNMFSSDISRGILDGIANAEIYKIKNLIKPDLSVSAFVTVSHVHSIPNISIRDKKSWGFSGHSTINHTYEQKAISGDRVVIDHATDLMWHQNGSTDKMNWNSARVWVKDLNIRGYAGYHDWRLPTVDELASLLEARPESKTRHTILYIDPVFSNKQQNIWTGDKKDLLYTAWAALFTQGRICGVSSGYGTLYVRPVRSVK